MEFLETGAKALRTGVVAAFLVVSLVAPLAAQLRSTADDRPYDDQLMRLSEILGAVHYLRELCGADEGQLWRYEMQRLVKVEGTTAIRRAKLVKGFNKGYRGYRRTYRSCTEPARLAVERFMEEGEQITSLLVQKNQ
jgi:uncharacterized protein (TIGR02301 family)